MPAEIYQQAYAGGGTAFTGNLDLLKVNLELVLGGFNTGNATIEVLPVGATTYKTLTLATVETSLLVLNTPLKSVRISGLSAGTYTITAYQF